ncbi:MAG TPA: glycosyltransferase family 39 protein, partial [Thermoanaerobaculia bacterium]|nr:glycosyltransferase family 39 protein [Thermoanaerobaculia bacterium]
MDDPREPRRRLVLWLLPPFVVGAVLRLWNLPDQILGGDEIHALRAAVNLPLREILTSYQQTDNCIPLTALYKVLMGAGVPLSEMVVRVPVLLCGVAALLALPLAFAGRVERRVTVLSAWLLAVSPSLVLYSRIARSYLPIVLFGFCAVVAFEAWWRTRSRRAGVAYVVFAALAVWFHLGAGPFVASPFLFAAGDVALHREERGRKLRDLVLLGLGLCLAFALFLVPSWGSLARLVQGKRQEQSIAWGELLPDLLRLQAGTARPWLAALFWVAAIAGLVLLIRRSPRLGVYTATVAAGHVAGLLVLSPMGLANPVILGRYVLVVLPLVLFWVAVAFGQVRIVGGLLVAALAFGGPFVEPVYRSSSFVHHNDFVAFIGPKASAPSVPAFYTGLKDGDVVEFPWHTIWQYNRAFYAYQRVHGRRVIVSTSQRVFFRPELGMKNVVA